MSKVTFAEEVLEQFIESITDNVFLTIQNDRELLQQYLRVISEEGYGNVNRYLGDRVKEKFGLQNAPTRQSQPQSFLIKSHQIFFSD